MIFVILGLHVEYPDEISTVMGDPQTRSVEYGPVNGLEKLALVWTNFSRFHLPRQFGVLVDEPSLTQHVGRSVLQLNINACLTDDNIIYIFIHHNW